MNHKSQKNSLNKFQIFCRFSRIKLMCNTQLIKTIIQYFDYIFNIFSLFFYFITIIQLLKENQYNAIIYL